MGNASAFFSALVSTLWTWLLVGVSAFAGYHVSQGENLAHAPGFDALPAFLRIPLQQQTDNTIVFTLAGVLTGFLLFFLVGYVWQALLDFVRLALVKGSLSRATADGISPGNAPITWHWFYYPRMNRLWHEYAETLHRQTLITAPDAMPQVRYRATIASEAIFSTQALVDVPMRVEFFRHLPGILTGAGIVSTFAGILLGLSAFDPSVEVQQITQQLKNLFTGITTAFIASFFAILAAILVTIIEKFLLHWRYAQITGLQHFVDDQFRAGVEPEYLAHLVSHGQTGMRQLQTEVGRLATSMATLAHPVPHPIEPLVPIQPLEPFAGAQGQTTDPAEPFRVVLNTFLAELSQLLNRTLESSGRRREDGRSLDIQLLSVGERLDVAMGEFVHAVVDARREMTSNHAAVQNLLQRQLEVLERLDGHLEQGNAQWGKPLEDMIKELPTREELALWVQSERQYQTDALLGLQKSLEQGVGRLPDKGDAVELLREIREWRTGMEQGGARQFLEASQPLVQQFFGMEQEIQQIKALSAQTEANTGLLLQKMAEKINLELQQNRPDAESSAEMAEQVAERLFGRLEQTFGGLSKGVFELRDRFSSERDRIVSAMEGWRADDSRSDEEKAQKIDRKMAEVIAQVNAHHANLTRVIDALNQNLSQDLDGVRSGLLSKSEEHTREMAQKVAELGRILEESIHTVGQEQTVFIEMLGERLEALRRRMRTK